MPSDRARSRTASTALRRFLLLCLLSAPVTATADVHLLDQALALRAEGGGGGRDDGGSKPEDGTRKPEEATGPAKQSQPAPPSAP